MHSWLSSTVARVGDRLVGVGFPRWVRDLSFVHSVQMALGAHLDSIHWSHFSGWGRVTGGVKLTTHLHLVPRLRKRGVTPPNPCVFMVCCLIKHRDKTIYNLYYVDRILAYHKASTCTRKTIDKNMDIRVHQTAFEPVIALFSLSLSLSLWLCSPFVGPLPLFQFLKPTHSR
jgi:hypothetical protein